MADGVVLIAGNIGVGKTELVRYIKSQLSPPDCTVEETIPDNALRLFYLARKVHDYDRKAITDMVEGSFLDNRLINHLILKHEEGIHVIDRGILEGVEIFARNSYQEGNLDHRDFEDLQRRAKKGFDQLGRTEPDKWLEKIVVYLESKNVSPLKKRLDHRNRQDEEVDMGYLEHLNEGYANFFSNPKTVYDSYGARAPVVLPISAEMHFDKDNLRSFHEYVWGKIQHQMEEMGMIQKKS